MTVNLEWPWPRSSLNATWSEQLCGCLFPHSLSLEKILSLLTILFVKAINAALCTYFYCLGCQIPLSDYQTLEEHKFYNFFSCMLKRAKEQFDWRPTMFSVIWLVKGLKLLCQSPCNEDGLLPFGLRFHKCQAPCSVFFPLEGIQGSKMSPPIYK